MKPQRKLQDQAAERVSLDSSGPGLGPSTSRLERERIWFLRFKKNPEEYQRIVKEFTPMISGYLLRLTKDEEAAKELTQETFVRAFSGFLKFEWRGISLAGFLFKIARNCFNGWWKRAKKNREFPVDLDSLDVAAKEETDKKIRQSEDAEVLASCLASIRPDFSEIIDLYYWGGLGTSEIAIVLKMKHPTVKSHLLRGRKALEKEMEKRGLVFASFSGLLGSENSDIEREGDSGGIGKTDQESLPK